MRDYNFFEPLQRKKGIHINVKSPVFYGFLVICLIILASAGTVAQNMFYKANLVIAKNELIDVQSTPEYQEAVKLQEMITALMSYDQLAGRALERIEIGKAILNTAYLKKISDTLPSTASYRNIAINTAGAAFTFWIPDRKAASELVYDLDHSGLFLDTVLVSVVANKDGSGGYTATITSVVKAGEPQ